MVNTIIEPNKINIKAYNTLTRIKYQNSFIQNNFFLIKKNGLILQTIKHKIQFIRNYSTVNYNSKLVELNPDFVSGFIDAEGSFTTVVYHKNRRWCTNSVFKITLHKKDIDLLKAIQAFFGVGRISGSDYVSYRVERVKSIVNSIIPHLDKHPLQTKKRADYELWKRIVILMDNKQHLTDEGLQEIINIKAAINRGVSEELLAEFPNTDPVSRPLVEVPEVLDIRPHWLAGFTAGDGSFCVLVEKDSRYRSGYRSKLKFNICQNFKDKLLMERIASYLNCGMVVENSRGEVNFNVHKFSHNYDIIIPFFDKYAINGVKAQDFKDWKYVALLIKNKAHLNKEGIDKIIHIKTNMNNARKIS